MEGYFRHPQALVESKRIGSGTRIWAFAHVLPGAVIGTDCNICDGVFVENEVVVGDRVTVKCGVQLWDGVTIENDVFIGPNATFTNDAFPRSRQHARELLNTLVRRGASIGANATILPGVTIGPNAMVGAGSVVTRNVPAHAIVMGSPARIIGYVEAGSTGSSVEPTAGRGEEHTREVRVPGVSFRRLPLVEDLRGMLVFGEVERHLPFVPKRVFMVFDVPSKYVRGQHAHRALHQFLICVRGSCAVMVDDGRIRDEVQLDSPTLGLHIPPMVWTVQYKYSPEALLMVLASDVYREEDYVRDYDVFMDLVS